MKRWELGIAMVAVRARFDGKKVIVPKSMQDRPPADVIVVFDNLPAIEKESQLWLKAQESAFAKVWDNDEDSVYDAL